MWVSGLAADDLSGFFLGASGGRTAPLLISFIVIVIFHLLFAQGSVPHDATDMYTHG